MRKIEINNNNYELVKNYKNGFESEAILDKVSQTDYFDNYDYIFGDWSYGKLRLKGLYDKNNPNCNNSNCFNKIDDYIKKYCAYECRYFVIKKK